MQTRYLYLLKQHQHFGTLGALTDVLKDRQKNKKDKEYIEDNIDNIRKDNNVNNSNSNRNSDSNK